jgi:hypothetical protein
MNHALSMDHALPMNHAFAMLAPRAHELTHIINTTGKSLPQSWLALNKLLVRPLAPTLLTFVGTPLDLASSPMQVPLHPRLILYPFPVLCSYPPLVKYSLHVAIVPHPHPHPNPHLNRKSSLPSRNPVIKLRAVTLTDRNHSRLMVASLL